MLKRIVLGGLLGAVVLFVWMGISWMALPWHCSTLKEFKNENAVAQVIMTNAFTNGVYVLPSTCHDSAQRPQKLERMRQGPMVFASVERGGMDPYSSRPYIISFITQWIAAMLVAWILILGGVHTYARGALTVVLIALVVDIAGLLPFWTWWRFSWQYVGVGIIDVLIGWILASFALVWQVRKHHKIA